MTLGTDNKRKSIDGGDEERVTKIFKEASEFFDQDSTGDGDTAPTAENEIVIQKEMIKQKYKNIKIEAVEENVPEPPETNLESEEVDDTLINQLISDDEDIGDDQDYDISDDEDDAKSKAVEDLKSKFSGVIEVLRKQLNTGLSIKNKIIENLRKENAKLKTEFESQIKVKKEILDDNLQKNKTDFDRQLSNVDEEREYLIEEIKFKDNELERKNGEIKVKDDTIKDWMEKYQKLDKLKIELKRSLDQREKHVSRLEEKGVRLESKLTLALKKKIVRTDIELRLQETERELEAVKEEKFKLEDENSKLEDLKYNTT